MTEREKVIKGLETCEMSGTREDYEGYGCPYFIYNDEASDDCQVTLFGEALALLKAQEPVKPVRKPEIFDSLYFCGKCSAKVGFQIRKDDSWRFKCKFCPDCGQAVKWE